LGQLLFEAGPLMLVPVAFPPPDFVPGILPNRFLNCFLAFYEEWGKENVLVFGQNLTKTRNSRHGKKSASFLHVCPPPFEKPEIEMGRSI
jgi:hypothetical protein